MPGGRWKYCRPKITTAATSARKSSATITRRIAPVEMTIALSRRATARSLLPDAQDLHDHAVRRHARALDREARVRGDSVDLTRPRRAAGRQVVHQQPVIRTIQV